MNVGATEAVDKFRVGITRSLPCGGFQRRDNDGGGAPALPGSAQ
jgi:hypothetical protein